MSNVDGAEISFSRLKDLVFQLDFKKKMDLIKAISKEVTYREEFYQYTESLARKYNIPQMSDQELDAFHST